MQSWFIELMINRPTLFLILLLAVILLIAAGFLKILEQGNQKEFRSMVKIIFLETSRLQLFVLGECFVVHIGDYHNCGLWRYGAQKSSGKTYYRWTDDGGDWDLRTPDSYFVEEASHGRASIFNIRFSYAYKYRQLCLVKGMAEVEKRKQQTRQKLDMLKSTSAKMTMAFNPMAIVYGEHFSRLVSSDSEVRTLHSRHRSSYLNREKSLGQDNVLALEVHSALLD